MISNNGKIHIKRYLGGFVPAIAQSIAFGVGSASENANDTKLSFEVGRADIIVTTFDFVSNQIVYKAALPEDFSGTIYEAAIYSVSADSAAGQFNSRLIASFDSVSEEWLDGGNPSVFGAGNSRIGPNSLRQAPTALSSKTDAMNQLAIDLSGYSGNDKFVFAYNVGTANTTSIRFRFMTDSSNYYDITLGVQTTGYKVVEVSKSSAVATGSPDWGTITELRVTTNSGAGGASQVDFDGIRIEDTDTVNPDYVMVAREVLSSPYAQQDGRYQAVEFRLDVNIT